MNLRPSHPPDPHEIHIWKVGFQQLATDAARFGGFLSREEKQRSENFLFDHRGPAVAFNLSYYEDLALIAVIVGRSVGIDVEKVRDMHYLDCIINRFSSREERGFIDSTDSAEAKPSLLYVVDAA